MTRWLSIAALALVVTAGAAASEGAQGRIVRQMVHSRALRGNLIGDSADREVTVYLPPSYDSDAAGRFPVLYLLHGFTSSPGEWLDGSYQGFDLRQAMDDLAGAGMTEYIVVMPFADNSSGGSFYVNSAAFGRWEDFIVDELVHFVDSMFRTAPGARNRGLAGQSMGGFGALYLGGRHPGRFGHVYAMSACCLGFVGELAPAGDAWTSTSSDPAATTRAAAALARRIRTMAAAFAPERRPSPDPPAVSTPLPFAAGPDGRVTEIEPVARAWRSYLPLERLARNPRPYRRLRSIALEFGREDQIPSVRDGSRAFARALQGAGIPHTLEEYTGGHVDHARERFETRLLPYFGKAFSRQKEHL